MGVIFRLNKFFKDFNAVKTTKFISKVFTDYCSANYRATIVHISYLLQKALGEHLTTYEGSLNCGLHGNYLLHKN